MVQFFCNIPVQNEQLNALFFASWEYHQNLDFSQVLRSSLGYVVALNDEQLIGYVNVAWDGGKHAFLLDITVHSDFQHQGIGRRLVEDATDLCRRAGISWLHVDFEQRLSPFYFKSCGFVPTTAGLLKLD
jgi:ribosomal protein S18 acetylase RimI-like enzyme